MILLTLLIKKQEIKVKVLKSLSGVCGQFRVSVYNEITHKSQNSLVWQKVIVKQS